MQTHLINEKYLNGVLTIIVKCVCEYKRYVQDKNRRKYHKYFRMGGEIKWSGFRQCIRPDKQNYVNRLFYNNFAFNEKQYNVVS